MVGGPYAGAGFRLPFDGQPPAVENLRKELVFNGECHRLTDKGWVVDKLVEPSGPIVYRLSEPMVHLKDGGKSKKTGLPTHLKGEPIMVPAGPKQPKVQKRQYVYVEAA